MPAQPDRKKNFSSPDRGEIWPTLAESEEKTGPKWTLTLLLGPAGLVGAR